MDLSRFDLVYAGAQKNIGPSGLAVVLVKRAMLDRGRKDLPKIFQYRVHADNRSLYNTPPTFGIYLVRNVLAWAKDRGGLPAIERENRDKAAEVYGAIDATPGFYRAPVDVGSRSLMNVVFRLPTEALEERFVAEAKQHNMVGLKGHRSVGGIRVSLYNAVPLAWATQLADFMTDFAKRNG
jgi:phosphoserine aminotransferase